MGLSLHLFTSQSALELWILILLQDDNIISIVKAFHIDIAIISYIMRFTSIDAVLLPLPLQSSLTLFSRYRYNAFLML